MLSGLKFPFQFDPALLQADLAKIGAEEWSPHYNERDYGGDWRGVALRSATGSANMLASLAPGPGGFIDTPLMDRCAYLRDAISMFQCPLKSVRLLSLAPQSFIREHSDHALGYEDGEIRIHIPVQTNPDVEFYVAGERLLLAEGQCYYVNVNLPHRVNNRGLAGRIHLVIDVEVNGWVHELFRRGRAEGWRIPRIPPPVRNWEDFRNLVLDEEALQERLRAHSTDADLAAATVQLGREHGFSFDDVGQGSGPVRREARQPPGWIPVKIAICDSVPYAEYAWLGARRFTEPFFADTVRGCLRNPFTKLFRQELPLSAVTPDLAPSGFIYHMTRCGSTLIAQMLAALPSVVMISEAAPIDEVLQARGLTEQTHVQWLRWVVAALGQRRTGGESRYFVKLDAWHIHHLPLIRAAFPATPWIFVFRDPAEVMASQQRSPGRPALPGALDPSVLGLQDADITRLSQEEWCAQALAGICRAALSFRGDSNGMFVDYRQLPGAVCSRIATHFGLCLDASEIEMMELTARFDAKNPGAVFQSDSTGKQAEPQSVFEGPSRLILSGLYSQLVNAI